MEVMQPGALRAIAIWSSANLLLMLGLGLMVSRLRIQLGTGVGTGGDDRLERAIRAHGNNAEYVPGALFLLLLAGATGASTLVLHLAGGCLLVARILHAIGIQQVDDRLLLARAIGNIATWLVIAGLGATVLVAVL